MFPIVKALLFDRDGTLVREVGLTRFWGAPPKILVHERSYYLRTSADEITENVTYRRTSAVRHID